MSGKKDKMEKCKTCKNFDRKKSNENWIVCPVIPYAVIVAKTSENCERYKQMPNVEYTP